MKGTSASDHGVCGLERREQHTLLAVRETDGFLSCAERCAAWIANQATGGEVVKASLLYDILAPTGESEFGEPRGVGLKGISGAHRLFPLAGVVDG